MTIDPNLPAGVYDPNLNESAPPYEEMEEEEFDRPWEEIAQDLADSKAAAGPEIDISAGAYISNDYDFDQVAGPFYETTGIAVPAIPTPTEVGVTLDQPISDQFDIDGEVDMEEPENAVEYNGFQDR